MSALRAPALRVREWVGTTAAPTLESLRGQVVVIHAFQMLCPGCVSHGLPQATRIMESFHPQGVSVLGLHCVFEHHDVMGPAALRAFMAEYRVPFPVAIDEPATHGSIPLTMDRYELEGTPSLILIDRAGCLRHVLFGRIPDLQVGALIASLALEQGVTAHPVEAPGAGLVADGCSEDGCALPNVAV